MKIKNAKTVIITGGSPPMWCCGDQWFEQIKMNFDSLYNKEKEKENEKEKEKKIYHPNKRKNKNENNNINNNKNKNENENENNNENEMCARKMQNCERVIIIT